MARPTRTDGHARPGPSSHSFLLAASALHAGVARDNKPCTVHALQTLHPNAVETDGARSRKYALLESHKKQAHQTLPIFPTPKYHDLKRRQNNSVSSCTYAETTQTTSGRKARHRWEGHRIHESKDTCTAAPCSTQRPFRLSTQRSAKKRETRGMRETFFEGFHFLWFFFEPRKRGR